MTNIDGGGAIEVEEESAITAVPDDFDPNQPPSTFDPRHAAGLYVQVLSAICGIVVASIILVFSVGTRGATDDDKSFLALAAGLLVLSLVACLLSAFMCAGVAAENAAHPRVYACLMLVGAAMLIGITAILAAIQVLSSVFLPNVKELFTLITAVSGVIGCWLIAVVLYDIAVEYGTPAESRYEDTPSRPRDPHEAVTVAAVLSIIAMIIVLAGYVAHLVIDHDAPSPELINTVVGVGLFLTSAVTLWENVHSFHTPRSDGRLGVLRSGVLVISAAVYVALIVAVLP